jgi:hypothetical protein
MGEFMKEVTVELQSVTGVNAENFDDVVKKLEELFSKDVEAAGLDSIWPPDMEPENQRKSLDKDKEMTLVFMKMRK